MWASGNGCICGEAVMGGGAAVGEHWGGGGMGIGECRDWQGWKLFKGGLP
jgi:hypothetical protein